MTLYSIHVMFWIHSTELEPNDKDQFRKVIKVPFVPYLMEGKRGHIYFKDSAGHETELPFTWGEVKWTCNGSKKGRWSMWVDVYPAEGCGKTYVQAISSDVRFKK